jgi:threonine aldolase
MKRGFGSDNHSGVHPQIFSSLQKVNQGHAPSYGTDDITSSAVEAMRKALGTPHAEIFFCFNGTAANVLALKALTKAFQAVLCADISHINEDECGAPEAHIGCKLVPLPSHAGKLSLESLKRALIRRGDQHFSQAKVVSLTQPTEFGTVYSLAELKLISEWARKEKLYIHIDGARLVNACVSLQVSLPELVQALDADVISWGGTKNGFLFGEAVVFCKPALAEDFKYQRKQLGQLPSKTRFIAAQFLEYFSTGLWQQIAEHSCKMAQILDRELRQFQQIEIPNPTQSNAVFAIFPRPWTSALREQSFFYIFDERTWLCRLMMSWDTQESDIHDFISRIRELSQGETR